MEKRKILHLCSILGLIIAVLFISSCLPSPAGQPAEQGGFADYSMIIFVVLIIAMMYFTMIRPQRKQQKEHQRLMEQLRSGDKVVNAAGIYGEIVSLNDNSVVLKVESGATIRVTRASIVGRLQKQ